MFSTGSNESFGAFDRFGEILDDWENSTDPKTQGHVIWEPHVHASSALLKIWSPCEAQKSAPKDSIKLHLNLMKSLILNHLEIQLNLPETFWPSSKLN